MAVIEIGSWVEIESVVLRPEERAPQIPDDTKAVPYVLRVSGFLQSNAQMGTEVKIKTLIGRTLSGRLMAVNPSYTHSFGSTVQELLHIGIEERHQ
jgi:hypothetical protein